MTIGPNMSAPEEVLNHLLCLLTTATGCLLEGDTIQANLLLKEVDQHLLSGAILKLGLISVGDRRTVKSITPTCEDTGGEPLPENSAKKISQNDDICPTCGQRIKPLTAAEKQRRYREKKRVGAT